MSQKTGGHLLAAALLLSVSPSALSQAEDGSQADIERGALLYTSYGCYACHLYSGSSPGAPLVPMRMPLLAFTAYVRNPPRPNLMPPYTSGELSDAQLADLWAYIRALPESPEASDIPLLNEILQELRQP